MVKPHAVRQQVLFTLDAERAAAERRARNRSLVVAGVVSLVLVLIHVWSLAEHLNQ